MLFMKPVTAISDYTTVLFVAVYVLGLYIVTQPNFDRFVDLTTSIHFIPSKFDP